MKAGERQTPLCAANKHALFQGTAGTTQPALASRMPVHALAREEATARWPSSRAGI